MRNFLIIFCLFLFSENSSQAAENKVERQLVAQDLNGETIDLAKLRGKVVIVNFWAEWCQNCLHEMQVLQSLYSAYKDQGLEIIGVSIDKKREMQKVLQRAARVSYPNALLENASQNNFPDITALPTTYIIDQQGREVAMLRGDNPAQNFIQILLPLFYKK